MLKLVIVSPKYQMNIGYIARVAKNFGINKLHIVNPRANILGKKAIMYSKHASDLLKNAKIYGTFDEAISKSGIVIGTTGLIRKANPKLRKVYYVDDLAKLSKKNICLVIGRDDIGLTSDELSKCDAVAYIPANPKYPVLNISHALVVFLFVLGKNKFKEKDSYDREYYKEQKILFDMFKRIVHNNNRVREKEEVTKTFEKIIKRSQPNMKELRSLIIALKQH
ncbi:MAG: RNA methyltransferase [Candidatus Micrarchaeia archaeon]